MATKKTRATPVAPAPADAPALPAPDTRTLKVLAPARFTRQKSARYAWQTAVNTYDGKTVQALLDAHAATPISCHKRADGKVGKPENGLEWVAWLTKQGVIALEG